MTRALPDAAAFGAVAADEAAAGVDAVAAGVPVEAGVGLADDDETDAVTSATVAGAVSFLLQPEARSAAKTARERSRIFMAGATL